jgi:RNase P subunit RPR2
MIESDLRSTFGMTCVQCDNELIAPEWSEYRSKNQNRHLWRCWKCDCCFETIVNTESMEDNALRDDVFPSRLVA